MKNLTRRCGVNLTGALLVSAGLVSGGCASLKAPTLQLQGLGVEKVRLTGITLDVRFHVRNPNAEPLRVERFEYELKLNGTRLGRGYHPGSFELEGFGSEQIESTVDLNFLSLPSGVKEVLERDEVRAEIRGDFYIAQSGGLKKLGFKNDAQVRIRK